MRLPRVFLALALLPAILLAQVPSERVTLRDGRVQEGRILGVANGAVEVELTQPNGQKGKIGLPLTGIAAVTMPEPTGVRAGLAHYEARDFARALAELRPVVEKWRGLPTDWARRVAAVMGDLYLETGDLTKAEAAYAEFARLYPGGKASLRGAVGLARLALARKDNARARQTLEPLAKAALEDLAPAEADGALYGQVFLLLGQLRESEGDGPGALQDYLRAVTLFYQDRAVTAAAQRAADALRAGQKVSVP